MRDELRNKGRSRRLKETLINRRVLKGEKKSSVKWWSDPIKIIPIVISSIALFISYLGWRESQRGRLINEEINRPLFTLSDITPTYHRRQEENTFLVTFGVGLKNSGKFTAMIDDIEVTPVNTKKSDACTIISTESLEEMVYYPIEVLPGMEVTPNGDVLLSSDCNNQTLEFFIIVKISYSDARSETHYEQELTGNVKVLLNEKKKK